MLIDWLSLVYDVTTDQDRMLVQKLSEGRDICVRLSHGEVRAEWFPRESKRSDSHQLTFGLTKNRITIDGSPARLVGESNVFGESDPQVCADRMVRAVSVASGVIMPAWRKWRFTRVDLTQNYDCGAPSHVYAALQSLSHHADGRHRATAYQHSVYWNKGSDLWRAKAYAKGTHLKTLVKAGKAGATEEQIRLAERLLRLEVSICNRYIKRAGLDWDTFTVEKAMELFREHVTVLIPENACEVSSEQQLAEALMERFGAKKGRRLMGTWGLIKSIGLDATKAQMSRTTFFQHQADFKSIGLSIGDLASGQILSFRPRAITARPVDSWDDLRRAA